MDRLKDRVGRWGQHLESYRRILAYVRDYRWHLALAGLSLVVIGLLGLAMPWIVQQIVDLLVGGQELDRLNLYALALGAILLLRSALGIVQSYVVAWVGERVVARLRRELYEHLLSLSLGFFAGRPVGKIQSRLTNDVQVIQVAVTSNIIVLVQQVVMAAGIVAIVAITNWRLTLLLTLSVPGMVFLTRIMGRRIRRVAREAQDVLAQASAVVEETVGGIRVVKSFAREDHEAARFGQKVNDLFSAAMRRARINAMLAPLIGLIASITITGILYYGGSQVIAGNLSPGDLIAYLIYTVMVASPIAIMADLYCQFQAAIGASQRLFELLDRPSEIIQLPDAKPLPPVVGEVIFDKVSFHYTSAIAVISDVSFQAEPGQVIALVGPSGAGGRGLTRASTAGGRRREARA